MLQSYQASSFNRVVLRELFDHNEKYRLIYHKQYIWQIKHCARSFNIVPHAVQQYRFAVCQEICAANHLSYTYPTAIQKCLDSSIISMAADWWIETAKRTILSLPVQLASKRWHFSWTASPWWCQNRHPRLASRAWMVRCGLIQAFSWSWNPRDSVCVQWNTL